MDEMQRTHLIPLQKDAFVCSAKCCDKHKDMSALQQCTVNCQQKVHAAHQVLYGNLEQFQVSDPWRSAAAAWVTPSSPWLLGWCVGTPHCLTAVSGWKF